MISAADLATQLGAVLHGNPELLLHAPARIEQAGPVQVTFLRDAKYLPLLENSAAGAVITTKRLYNPKLNITWLLVEEPYAAFALAVSVFYPPQAPSFETSRAYIDPFACVSSSAKIGFGAYIGKQTVIAEDVVIYPQVYLGNNVNIGKGTVLYPGVKIMDGCSIGAHCILHSGVVIGADGFGFAPLPDGTYRKIPQMGKVILEDNVEIGANSCIDRATLGDTIIRKGTKIDNLVQVGHNVDIGEHCVIASQTGFAGSGKIGHHARIGGQAGFAPHITIAPHAQINAQTGVAKSVEKEKSMLTGSPAEPYMDYYRKQVLLKKLENELQLIKESLLLLKDDGKNHI